MEVDAVWGGKNGKKGNGKKGKNKGQEGDKSKGKKGDKDPSKTSHKPLKDAFEVYCSNECCGKWGHRWRDCRKKGGGAYTEPPPEKNANAVEQAVTANGSQQAQGQPPAKITAVEMARTQEMLSFGTQSRAMSSGS